MILPTHHSQNKSFTYDLYKLIFNFKNFASGIIQCVFFYDWLLHAAKRLATASPGVPAPASRAGAACTPPGAVKRELHEPVPGCGVCHPGEQTPRRSLLALSNACLSPGPVRSHHKVTSQLLSLYQGLAPTSPSHSLITSLSPGAASQIQRSNTADRSRRVSRAECVADQRLKTPAFLYLPA